MSDLENQSPTKSPRRPTPLHELLFCHGIGEPSENLVALLTDAMHWCDVHGENFRDAYHLARAQYLAESNILLQREWDCHDAHP